MFKDINPSLQTHPDTHDITIKTEIAAINGSIKNLVLTNAYERPYQPLIAGNIGKILFKIPSQQNGDVIKTLIEQTISNFEKRATDVAVIVSPTSDQFGYNVYIVYNAVVSGKRATLTLGLSRH